MLNLIATPGYDRVYFYRADLQNFFVGFPDASEPTIPRIVALQQRVAHETGCAFFDTYTAMGGEGTMARWYGAHPRLVVVRLHAGHAPSLTTVSKGCANVAQRDGPAGFNRLNSLN